MNNLELISGRLYLYMMYYGQLKSVKTGIILLYLGRTFFGKYAFYACKSVLYRGSDGGYINDTDTSILESVNRILSQPYDSSCVIEFSKKLDLIQMQGCDYINVIKSWRAKGEMLGVDQPRVELKEVEKRSLFVNGKDLSCGHTYEDNDGVWFLYICRIYRTGKPYGYVWMEVSDKAAYMNDPIAFIASNFNNCCIITDKNKRVREAFGVGELSSNVLWTCNGVSEFYWRNRGYLKW